MGYGQALLPLKEIFLCQCPKYLHKYKTNKIPAQLGIGINSTESLADILKEKGLAKDYDGEGARPEW